MKNIVIRVKHVAKSNKKIMLAMVATVLTMSVGLMSVFNYVSTLSTPQFSESVSENFDQAIETLPGELISEATEMSSNEMVGVEEDLGKPSIASNMSIRQVSALLNADVKQVDIPIACHKLLVNGKTVAFFKDRQEARDLLKNISTSFVNSSENSELLSVDFVENVRVISSRVSLYDFNGYSELAEAEELVRLGTNEKREYKVVSGDTISEIASNHNMKEADLYAANPELNTQKYLQIDQELNLVVPVPLINVKTIEKVTYKEAIPFEVSEEPTDNLYKGEKSIKVKGAKGETQFVAEVARVNGVKTESTVLSEEVIVNPKTQVLYVGTKNPPPKMGTGSFARPASGYIISSRFGAKRRNGYHTGIDLAMPTGSPVLAADGGRVIFSGYRGSYGRLLIIDHGGRLKSYYAHCSSLLVKKGDKIFKGQRIALSGNTGRSTGPHLHFEIRVGDVPVNPTKHVGL